MFSELISQFKRIKARATPQIKRPFYIGLAVGLGLVGLVLLGIYNTDTFWAMPSSFDGIAISDATWGLKPSNLMMVLPLGAFLVVLARSFIGLQAFGLFTPMLIALAFLQIGPVMGPIVLGAAVLSGMILAPALLKLRMTRVGFLGTLISLVVFTLVALQQALDAQLQVDAFPVVVCALVVERWWRQWEKDGAFAAAKLAFNTFMIAIVIQFVMVSHIALMLIEASPLLMPAATGIAIGILGRYRGLRITEIGRFAPIWLERRRIAREGPDGDEEEEIVEEEIFIDRNTPEEEFLAAWERGPPLEGMWVINSVEDLMPSARRQVPQRRQKPDSEAQFEPRIGASKRPLKHNAWIVRSPEDV